MKFCSPLVLAMALLAGSANAFAPSSTFVPRSSSAVVTYERTVSYAMPPSTGRRNTALQMNLVDRFMRVAKANINNVLMNLEGPEKIMNQAVEDMQNDLVKIRQSYAEVTATQRRLQKQRETAASMAQDWYNRAQLALRAGNEELAKQALTRRQQQLEIIKTVESQMDVQGTAMDKMYEGMQALESKILEAKQKKAQFIARAKTAENTQKVNDMLSGLTGKTSMDAFKRMEEKVEALEAAAEVSAEMSSFAGNVLPGSLESDLENDFRLLEGSAAVDEELKKLKDNLLMESSTENDSPFRTSKKQVTRIPVNWSD